MILSDLDGTAPVRAMLGPTNTGKTHYAIDRLLAHPSGMIGLPLRLLAREVYQKIASRIGIQSVALVTGEERIVPPQARYWVATVEAMPLDIPVDCLVVDEIQTATDFDRGHVFTNRILGARGRRETLFLGAATMIPVIRTLLPGTEIVARPRLSRLTYAGSKKITRQPRRTAIVAFSAAEVYAIAELVRRERGGAAVVMGALSPRTRNAQVALFENGDVDFLIATDAIGMGLNLDLQHVAFAAETKYDGRQSRRLTPAEYGQIAGRAGRHMNDGTFGVTGRAAGLDDDLAAAIEAHDFDPVRQLQWRNGDLDFASIAALRAALDTTPTPRALTRAPTAVDQRTLETVASGEAAAYADRPERVRLLWECCQLPDYRDISPSQHAHIVNRIFTDLARFEAIDADWIAEQVRFCDNVTGDIDTLSNRIRQIRTWTFVANRRSWLKEPSHWREKTRDIEDRLSDALHEKLTQRFVDRRTSVLIRHLRDRHMTSPQINDQGEVTVEGHPIGTIEGFRFSLARADGELDAKGLRAAAASAVAPEIGKRAARLASAPNEEIILGTDGYVRWRGEVVAEIAEGDSLLAPRLIILADDALSGPELERVQDRLDLWLRHLINTQLDQVMALREPADLEGTARGVAYRLSESLGILPRSAIANDVRELDQDVRGKMRKFGIKFGAYHIYLPMSLKPAPRELALILYALKHGGVRQPGVSELPQTILSGRTSFEADPEIARELYEIAGFRLAGKRAVRVDILERLADLIRPLIALNPITVDTPPPGAAPGNGFRVTVDMTSLLGCAGEDFASILKSLGYRVQRTPVERQAGADDLRDAARIDGATDTEIAEIASAAPTTDDADLADAARLDADQQDQTAPEAAPEAPEPEFDEVWFPANRSGDRSHKPRHAGKNRHQRTADDAKPNGDRHAKRPPRNARTAQAGKGKKPGAEHAKPHREKPIDPDSPFAALAALKNLNPR